MISPAVAARVVEACASMLEEYERGHYLSLLERHGWRLAVAKLREMAPERVG